MKKCLALLLCLVVIFSLGITAAAADPDAPKVVDNAALLTAEEEAVLTKKANDLVYAYQMDVVILTVPDLDGHSAQVYADDFYDRNGYGCGENYSGILFLLAIDEREWYISTCGEAIYVFTDYGLDMLGDQVVPYLSAGEYYEGFTLWLELLPDYFDAYLAKDPVDSYVPGQHTPEKQEDVVYYQPQYTPNYLGRFLIALIIGMVAALVSVLIMRSRMNTAKAQRDAVGYMKQGSYQLTVHRDMFLYSRVSKTPRPKDNGGSGHHGGGSSVHRSSSGRSHGGRGGKF